MMHLAGQLWSAVHVDDFKPGLMRLYQGEGRRKKNLKKKYHMDLERKLQMKGYPSLFVIVFLQGTLTFSFWPENSPSLILVNS